MEEDKKDAIDNALSPITPKEDDEGSKEHEKKELDIAYVAADLMNKLIDMHENIKGMDAFMRERLGGIKEIDKDMEDNKDEKKIAKRPDIRY